MALQIQYETSMGFSSDNAYLRIDSFTSDKYSVRAQCTIFYNQTAKIAGANAIGSSIYRLEIQNGATMSDIYTALKLLPEFTNAIDI